MNFIHVFLVLFGIGIQPGSNPVGLVVRGLAEEKLEKQRIGYFDLIHSTVILHIPFSRS